MKYQHSFDIWQIPHALMRHIQPGQWIYAGDKSHKGKFLGVKKNGVVVVAWLGNINSHKDKNDYIKCLRQYAIGG